MIEITRREEFCAAHRLFNPAWPDEMAGKKVSMGKRFLRRFIMRSRSTAVLYKSTPTQKPDLVPT